MIGNSKKEQKPLKEGFCTYCKTSDDSNNLCALMEYGRIYNMHRNCAIKKFKEDADGIVKDLDFVKGAF